jgi:hypothetical protein
MEFEFSADERSLAMEAVASYAAFCFSKAPIALQYLSTEYFEYMLTKEAMDRRDLGLLLDAVVYYRALVLRMVEEHFTGTPPTGLAGRLKALTALGNRIHAALKA